MKQTTWPEELVARYGEEPIWTATWHDCYIQHHRYHQTFRDAEKLAREHHGQVLLPIREFRSERGNRIP